MKKLTVSTTSSTYDILIKKGILSDVKDYVANIIKGKRIMIVTDSNVAPLYLNKVTSAFSNSDYTVESFVFTAGEKSKNLDTVSAIYDKLSECNFDRKDLLIALGGGVCGDICGFVAATYMRGVDFVQIPTTLLSQVDSSVGGKTGVNTAFGKNLVGAFYQPKLVLIDPDTLSTLTQKIFSDGLGEVVKYGCIRDLSLFEFLENNDVKDNIEHVIYECLKIKRDVVNEDEKENSLRMILNFGHTLGHSIEKLSDFCISHGQAVAIGMVLVTQASENNLLTEDGTTDRLIALCHKLNLETKCEYPLLSITQNAMNDKKGSSSALNLILIDKIGSYLIHKIEKSQLLNFLSK